MKKVKTHMVRLSDDVHKKLLERTRSGTWKRSIDTVIREMLEKEG